MTRSARTLNEIEGDGLCVGVTGGDGFLGWHIRTHLQSRKITSLSANRSTFSDHQALDDFVSSCDVIVHVAGVNRAHDDQAILDGNIALATALCDALRRAGVSVPILYTNSTHSETESPYGIAKRRAAEVVAAHQLSVNAPFLNLVLPHLFGEFGRPNYNSAVATFAFELANGGTPEIHAQGQLELLHAQDVAARCVAFVQNPLSGDERMAGRSITVGDAWSLLSAQHNRYVNEFTIPLFADRFELRMFNALRAQLYLAGFYPRDLVQHTDQRGSFVELTRADGLGQTSFSTSAPGVSRGDHYHFDKIERFIVVHGDATILTRRVLTDELQRFDVTGQQPAFIDMPPMVTHKIVNPTESEVTTLFWAGDHFDPESPDTWIDPVESV